MKMKNLLLTVAMALIAMTGFGQPWQIGSPNAADVTATLNGNTLIISGAGDMIDFISSSDFETVNTPWDNIHTTITSLIINEGITRIGKYAFMNFSGITSITIPESITSIGDVAFANCTSLSTVNYNAENCTVAGITNVVFGSNTPIQTLNIGNNVKFIPHDLFNHCVSLPSVVIPDNVETIDSYAFQNCTNLQSVTIGKKCSSIKSSVFGNCTALSTITNMNPVPQYINAYNVFSGIPDLGSITLHIPFGAKAAYQAEYVWKNFNIVNDIDIPPLYTVTYDTQGSGAVDSEDVYSGYKATQPADPDKDGYIFGGWFKEAACTNAWNFDTDVVTGNITLYAKWMACFLVTFNSQGGSAVASEKILPNNKITRPASPTKSGYVFSRWFKEAACINAWTFDTDVVTANLTLYAGWKTVGNNSIYYVKPNGTGDGTTWSKAAGNIQDMIDESGAGDEIWVSAGTYYPTLQTNTSDVLTTTFLMKDGVSMYGGFAGNETSIDARAKSDKSGNGKVEAWEFTNETILSGRLSDTEKSNRVVDMGYSKSFTTETQFDGFTVTEGSLGISVSKTGVVNNCIIRNNSGSGGVGSSGTISNCLISSNSYNGVTGRISSTCNYGICLPAYYNAKGGGINSSGKVVNCTVSYNTCNMQDDYGQHVNVQGGGIYNNTGSVINCVVIGNTCQYTYSWTKGVISISGSGIYNYYGTVANCLVRNNTGGSGIDNYGYSSNLAYVYCSTVVKNSSPNIYTYNDGYDFIYNCITDDEDMTQFINPGMSDYHLISGSKYIDAGSLDNIPDWIKTGTDLAGNPRTHDGKISMGAYEYDPSYVGTDTGTGTGTDTGIHELQQQAGIVVSPNPATDFVSVSGLQGNETLYFYNINGQLLITRKASVETENVPVGNLPSGIYFVKISNGQTLKFVKR